MTTNSNAIVAESRLTQEQCAELTTEELALVVGANPTGEKPVQYLAYTLQTVSVTSL